MICPQTKAECDSDYGCKLMGCRVAPPPPTLAEIERLVLAFEEAVYHFGYEQLRKGADAKSWAKFSGEANAARAALIAAYQRLGVK